MDGSPVAYRTPLFDLVAGDEYTFIYAIDGQSGDYILTSEATEGKDGDVIWQAESGVYTFTVMVHNDGTQATQQISVTVTASGMPVSSPWTFDYEPTGVHQIPAEYLQVEGGGGGGGLYIVNLVPDEEPVRPVVLSTGRNVSA